MQAPSIVDRPLRLTCVACDPELKKSCPNTTRSHADEPGLRGVETTYPAEAEQSWVVGDTNAVTVWE